MMRILPPPLEKGDRIGVIAPASPIPDREKLERGIEVLESLGFQIELGKNIFKSNLYLAGSDEERLSDLMEFVERDDIKAIIAARGGYGTLRLLPLLDFEKFYANPKIIMGFSDLTSLLIPITEKTGLITFEGPMVASLFSRRDELSIEYFLKAVQIRDYAIAPNPLQIYPIVPGSAQGELIGGCLSLINALLATPFEPDFEGKILFIEEVDEPLYRIDRMLTQLRLAGVFNKIKGIVFGGFVGDFDLKDLLYVLTDRTGDLGIPVVYGFPFGHGDHFVTLPIGAMGNLIVEKGRSQLRVSFTVNHSSREPI